MMDRIKGNHIPLEELVKVKRKENQVSPLIKGQDFSSVLDQVQKKDGLHFSTHAQRRMINRDIVLNKEDLNKMEQAVNRLQKKGGHESLLLHRDVAYLVSVKNRTIITAMEESTLKEHVFTNIDSAVIIKD